MTHRYWLLPDGVDEVLPPNAELLEILRRQILDLFRCWGYRLCIPPLVEFLDSLLSGIGEDLELQTFKLIDQVSGRLLGIPADMTPQVARIDAHRLPCAYPQRLCYLGPVLHTRPDKFAGSRNPLQVGAELYGHGGIESDAEVLCLMIEVLKLAGVTELTIELGHMGVLRGLIAAANLDADGEDRLRDALLRKAGIEVRQCLAADKVEGRTAELIEKLLALNGGAEIAAAATEVYRAAPAEVRLALESLAQLVELVRRCSPAVDIHIDLAELRGYNYHTGVIFAAYTPRLGRAIAWGGRYDSVGRNYGGPRPATGFSTDLKSLLSMQPAPAGAEPAIYAPAGTEPALLAAIAEQRARGRIVIQALPGQAGGPRELRCSQVLRRAGGIWRLADV